MKKQKKCPTIFQELVWFQFLGRCPQCHAKIKEKYLGREPFPQYYCPRCKLGD